jgi:hypothetical protein
MSVSKRLRFEILRRDNYTCRYCGKNAAETELHVDHVLAVALGGKDEATNLVTSCEPCNTGKASIAPDSALVADIEEKALLWDRALALSVEHRLAALDEQRQLIEWFEDEWIFRHDFAAPMPDDWEASLIRFAAHGLPVPEIDDALNVAYAAPVKPESMWRYFCGVCWRKVETIRDTARSLIDAGEVA